MKQRNTLAIVIIVLMAVVAIAYTAYQQLSPDQQVPASNQQAQVAGTAQQAPALAEADFTVKDAQGADVSLSQISSGKPVLVNIWATWCPYCVDEMGELDELYEQYGDKVEFAVVDAVDGSRETTQDGAAYIEASGFSFPVYYDEQRDAVDKLGITAYPTTYIFDSNGTAAYAMPGRFTKETIASVLESVA